MLKKILRVNLEKILSLNDVEDSESWSHYHLPKEYMDGTTLLWNMPCSLSDTPEEHDNAAHLLECDP